MANTGSRVTNSNVSPFKFQDITGNKGVYNDDPNDYSSISDEALDRGSLPFIVQYDRMYRKKKGITRISPKYDDVVRSDAVRSDVVRSEPKKDCIEKLNKLEKKINLSIKNTENEKTLRDLKNLNFEITNLRFLLEKDKINVKDCLEEYNIREKSYNEQLKSKARIYRSKLGGNKNIQKDKFNGGGDFKAQYLDMKSKYLKLKEQLQNNFF